MFAIFMTRVLLQTGPSPSPASLWNPSLGRHALEEEQLTSSPLASRCRLLQSLSRPWKSTLDCFIPTRDPPPHVEHQGARPHHQQVTITEGGVRTHSHLLELYFPHRIYSLQPSHRHGGAPDKKQRSPKGSFGPHLHPSSPSHHTRPRLY